MKTCAFCGEDSSEHYAPPYCSATCRERALRNPWEEIAAKYEHERDELRAEVERFKAERDAAIAAKESAERNHEFWMRGFDRVVKERDAAEALLLLLHNGPWEFNNREDVEALLRARGLLK